MTVEEARVEMAGYAASEQGLAAGPAAATTTQSPACAPPSATTTYYPTCAAVRTAGKAPLHRGDPGYRPALDGDGDGLACE